MFLLKKPVTLKQWLPDVKRGLAVGVSVKRFSLPEHSQAKLVRVVWKWEQEQTRGSAWKWARPLRDISHPGEQCGI